MFMKALFKSNKTLHTINNANISSSEVMHTQIKWQTGNILHQSGGVTGSDTVKLDMYGTWLFSSVFSFVHCCCRDLTVTTTLNAPTCPKH